MVSQPASKTRQINSIEQERYTDEYDKLSHIRRFNHTNSNWNAEIITYTFKNMSDETYITYIEWNLLETKNLT